MWSSSFFLHLLPYSSSASSSQSFLPFFSSSSLSSCKIRLALSFSVIPFHYIHHSSSSSLSSSYERRQNRGFDHYRRRVRCSDVFLEAEVAFLDDGVSCGSIV